MLLSKNDFIFINRHLKELTNQNLMTLLRISPKFAIFVDGSYKYIVYDTKNSVGNKFELKQLSKIVSNIVNLSMCLYLIQ